MKDIRVTEINIYPVKSLGHISLKEAKTTSRGFEYDRRWMLIDQNNHFITQRNFPILASVKTRLDDFNLIISQKSEIKIPFSFEGEKIKVQVWRSLCDAILISKTADDFFSELLGIEVRLVYMPDSTEREINQNYGNGIVSFADGYPFLLTNETSLGHLNSFLDEDIPMERFRPNIVISGDTPFEEDQWKEIRINSINFKILKPCERCVVTTIDQNTGKVSGTEPLKTLAKINKIDGKVIFGQNMICNKAGIIKVGDKVEVLELR